MLWDQLSFRTTQAYLLFVCSLSVYNLLIFCSFIKMPRQQRKRAAAPDNLREPSIEPVAPPPVRRRRKAHNVIPEVLESAPLLPQEEPQETTVPDAAIVQITDLLFKRFQESGMVVSSPTAINSSAASTSSIAVPSNHDRSNQDSYLATLNLPAFVSSNTTWVKKLNSFRSKK